jgi:hypothetical protein
MRGTVFVPFCPYCETLPARNLLGPCTVSCQDREEKQWLKRRPELSLQPECLGNVLFKILEACKSRGKQAPGMDCPTKQPAYYNGILVFAKASVCSVVHRFAAYLKCLVSANESPGVNQRVVLFCDLAPIRTVTDQRCNDGGPYPPQRSIWPWIPSY